LSKFKSVPCEHLKNKLKNSEIEFIEEYQPLLHLQRYYSIDIAFPDKKIGIEINGNQHYNKKGDLKEYYQKRHDEIEKEGWVIYELHYLIAYKKDLLETLILPALRSDIKIEFNYSEHKRKIKEQKNKKKPSEIDPNWRNRPRPNARKVERPSKEELEVLVKNFPMTTLGKRFGVSGTAVCKWCKIYGIPYLKKRTPRGYRTH